LFIEGRAFLAAGVSAERACVDRRERTHRSRSLSHRCVQDP
jgi:hypothetical protein